MTQGRYIYSRQSSMQVPDLLQAIFTAELIQPSMKLWLASPWLGDIAVLDNQSNSFLSLEPTWNRGKVRLSQVLVAIAERGTSVRVATRPNPYSRGLVEKLQEVKAARGLDIRLYMSQELHTKGLLGDDFHLGGSMNFTYSGITINEEAVSYETDPATVAERRVVFEERWGDA